jgi:DNA-binding NtrC family response regulator
MVNNQHRKRLLFVDDETNIRLTLSRILVKHGFEVTSLAGLDDALTEMKVQGYDVLLSDLNLPEPNAGFTIVDEMRKAQPQCMNIILTGDPADETLQQARARGVTHYFVKPVDVEGLVHTIREELQRGSSKKPALERTVND